MTSVTHLLLDTSVRMSHLVRSVKGNWTERTWLSSPGQGLVRRGEFDGPADRRRGRDQAHASAAQLGAPPGGQQRPQSGAV
jgi:hypothetical protein